MSQVFKRRFVREKVLQVLYAYEVNKDGHKATVNSIMEEIKDEADKEFAANLIIKVINYTKELDENIKGRVANWEMNRIALIDKVLLRIGICELIYFPDIPPKVSINETIEIAKEYSTARSGKFINGILDAILSELKETGKLNKTGRGLVDESILKSSPKK
ncbi:MAG TPA: transcription antitermination factor NusB [Ignavibacteriaceae bacterium]|nr:transcription antitermination factor NusB [Ignavibacteriaceae bacterium]